MNGLISILLSIVMFLSPTMNFPHLEVDKSEWNTDYTYVLVHGVIGWGERFFVDNFVSYFGFFDGNLVKYLRARGLDCYTATVSSNNSAWDRSCELYAQLTGTRTDYGEAHSKRCNHPRYGTDYTGKALIHDFDAEHKINLIGHSFGGTTVLEFLELLANGDETERNSTPPSNLSPLFAGGKADWVYSLTTLASPTNGTTLYELYNTDTKSLNRLSRYPGTFLLNIASTIIEWDRVFSDTAVYEMQVDRAVELTSSCETIDSVYYFSIPCALTQPDGSGNQVPKSKMELLIKPLSRSMGMFEGVTANGIAIDDRWKQNDGLVNTFSERAPLYAPQQDISYDHMEDIRKGIWNVFPTVEGDHVYFCGGFFRTNDIRTIYFNYIDMINKL